MTQLLDVLLDFIMSQPGSELDVESQSRARYLLDQHKMDQVTTMLLHQYC